MFGDADIGAIPAERLADELAAQAAIVDAELCRLVELAAECERRMPRIDEGVSFAGWLAWHCSLLPGQAREYERVGKRLSELPRIREAFARGELSYGKVSILTRVAEPESEAQLAEFAEVLTASQLQRAAGAYRQLPKEQAGGQQEREFLNYQWRDDGALALRGCLAAEDGALVLSALDAGREALWERRSAEAVAADPGASGAAESPRPSNAEALVAMADLALANPEREQAGGERYQVVVHVDAQTLAEDADGRCELGDGHRLAAETARRLSCDASIVKLLEGNGEPLALGRKQRTISPALRRALAARDRGCRFPGCANTRFVDGHHLEHWSQGGETNLENLLSLCRRHHRLVHERGYTVTVDDEGAAWFTNQYGVRLDNVPRPPPISPEALRHRHRHVRLAVDGDTCKKGTGDPMNLGLAVDAIAEIIADGTASAVALTGSR